MQVYTTAMLLENRRHLRIRDTSDVRWTILGTELMGEGQVVNISLSGMLLQTDHHYNPHVKGKVYVDAHGAVPLEYGAKKGRIVWTKKLENQQGYRCGVEFEPNTQYEPRLNKWMNARAAEFEQTTNVVILSNLMK